MLFEVPTLGANLEPIRANRGFHVAGTAFSGRTGRALLQVVTDDPRAALDGSQLVFNNDRPSRLPPSG